MAYQMYLDGVLLPVTPSKLQMKIANQNKTMNLINGQEINQINLPGLTEISFEAVLPHTEYPFTQYEDGFLEPDFYLEKLEALKTGKQAFSFICIRSAPGGDEFYDTNMRVSLENYSVTEDAAEGMDVCVTIELKQHVVYGTRTFDPPSVDSNSTEVIETGGNREAEHAPAPKTYRVKKGDSLWNIAKAQLGNGSRYTEIYELNRDKIRNPSLIYPDQVLIMP